MGKDIRRGHKDNVICAMCGQITRRDRAVYAYKEDPLTKLVTKVYYCPDCAKKVKGVKLYKSGNELKVNKTEKEKESIKKKFINIVE